MNYLNIAKNFGRAIVANDFAAAHALLTKDAQQLHTPDGMKHDVANMIAYADEPIQRYHVMDEFTLKAWPTKQPNDLAWVYIALEGKAFAEAASIVLTTTLEGVRIREITWGRP